MKLDEDPWDNYLIHDAKYIMPLLCHQQALTIEEQSLVADFINFAIKEENISEFKLKGKALIQELVSFAKTFNEEEEDQPNILE